MKLFYLIPLLLLLFIPISFAGFGPPVEIPDGHGGTISQASPDPLCNTNAGTGIRNCPKYALIYVDVFDHRIRNGKLDYAYSLTIELDADPGLRQQFSHSVNYFENYYFEWDEDWWIPEIVGDIDEPTSWMIAPVKIAYCELPDGRSVGDRYYEYTAEYQLGYSYIGWDYPIGNPTFGSKGGVSLYESGLVQGVNFKSSHTETIFFDCYFYTDPLIDRMIELKDDYSYTWDISLKTIDINALTGVKDYLNFDDQMVQDGSSCIGPYNHLPAMCHQQYYLTLDYDDLFDESQGSDDPSNYPIDDPSGPPDIPNYGNHTSSNSSGDANPGSNSTGGGIGGTSEGAGVSGGAGSIGLGSLAGLYEAQYEARRRGRFFTSFTSIVRLVFALILLMFYAFQIICVTYVFIIIIPDVFFRIQRFFVHMTRLKKR